MKPDSSESLRKGLRAPVRILIEAAVTTGVILVVVLLAYHFFFSLSALIKKLRSPDPVVRLEGARAAYSFPSFEGTEEQERLAAELRTLLENETVREIKIQALHAISSQISKKNVEILPRHIMSEEYEIAWRAIYAGKRHAYLYPGQAWKIVGTLAFMAKKNPKSRAALELEDLLGKRYVSSPPSIVDLALKLRFNEKRYSGELVDTDQPEFLLCDYPCAPKTGEKLDSETRTRLTLEASEFARKLELVE